MPCDNEKQKSNSLWQKHVTKQTLEEKKLSIDFLGAMLTKTYSKVKKKDVECSLYAITFESYKGKPKASAPILEDGLAQN